MSSLWSASCGAKNFGSESIAQPSRAVPNTTSIATGTIAFVAVRVTFGRSGDESGSSFITPVMFATASTPLSARMTPTNWIQVTAKLECAGSNSSTFRCSPLNTTIKTTTSTAGTASQIEKEEKPAATHARPITYTLLVPQSP